LIEITIRSKGSQEFEGKRVMNVKSAPTLDLTSGSLLLALAAVWGGSFFFAEIALSYTFLARGWVARRCGVSG
jgi:hypothetical protein